MGLRMKAGRAKPVESGPPDGWWAAGPLQLTDSDWGELETTLRTIRDGSLFVPCRRSPPNDVELDVHLELPQRVGVLRFRGRVVFVSPSGFGLQIDGLTRRTKTVLGELIDLASHRRQPTASEHEAFKQLGVASASASGVGLRLTLTAEERAELQDLRGELDAMNGRSDLEVLGLDGEYRPEDLRFAFNTSAQRWHPSASELFTTPETRELAQEIFLRLEEAYSRLSVARLQADHATPQAGALAEPPAAHTDVASPPGSPSEPTPTREASPTSPRRAPTDHDDQRHAARRPPSPFIRSVLERTHRTASLRAVLSAPTRRATTVEEPAPETSPVSSGLCSAAAQGVMRAAALVQRSRHAEAVAELEEVARQHPEHRRVQVALLFAQARMLVSERRFAEARARYEALLELEPGHEVAQAEMLMLACLG